MSQTVIFLVGIVVFALTVWGSVMVGGYWLGEVAESEHDDPVDPPPAPRSSPDPS